MSKTVLEKIQKIIEYNPRYKDNLNMLIVKYWKNENPRIDVPVYLVAELTNVETLCREWRRLKSIKAKKDPEVMKVTSKPRKKKDSKKKFRSSLQSSQQSSSQRLKEKIELLKSVLKSI